MLRVTSGPALSAADHVCRKDAWVWIRVVSYLLYCLSLGSQDWSHSLVFIVIMYWAYGEHLVGIKDFLTCTRFRTLVSFWRLSIPSSPWHFFWGGGVAFESRSAVPSGWLLAMHSGISLGCATDRTQVSFVQGKHPIGFTISSAPYPWHILTNQFSCISSQSFLPFIFFLLYF